MSAAGAGRSARCGCEAVAATPVGALFAACATDLLWCLPAQSLVAGEEFQHILRVLNTNVDGKQKVMYAMTSIRGIGRRFANLVCKKAEVDMSKR
jgi:Ribosomal protein S13/S18